MAGTALPILHRETAVSQNGLRRQKLFSSSSSISTGGGTRGFRDLFKIPQFVTDEARMADPGPLAPKPLLYCPR